MTAPVRRERGDPQDDGDRDANRERHEARVERPHIVPAADSDEYEPDVVEANARRAAARRPR